jgi:hypothetical protein
MNLMHKRIIFLLVLILFCISMIPLKSSAATLNSNWTTSPPTINGTASAGEWDDAYVNAIIAYYGSTPLSVTLYAKNDADNLYLRIQWPDVTGDQVDTLCIMFDEGNDGNWSGPGSENGVAMAMNSTYYEGYDGYNVFASTPVFPDVTTQDGQQACSWLGSYFIELSIPLDCSDPEDMQCTAGDVIGIAIIIGNDINLAPPTGKVYEYPNGTFSEESITATFQLASAPGGIGTPFNFVLLLGSLIFITIITIWKKTPLKNANIKAL